MALAGKGAIIIWNDITPEGRAGFYDWHHHEHMPERLGIPGFLRGSRYVALAPQPSQEYLTVYELTDRAVATSPPYLERLNAPTTWSLKTFTNFRNMLRALTEVEISYGAGPGGVVAAVRFADDEQGAAVLARLRTSANKLEELSRLPRISGVHLCATDAAASAAKTAESRHRDDVLVAPVAVVLIEGCDAGATRHAIIQLANVCNTEITTQQIGMYALEHTIASKR